jgi:hypothetical protein
VSQTSQLKWTDGEGTIFKWPDFSIPNEVGGRGGRPVQEDEEVFQVGKLKRLRGMSVESGKNEMVNGTLVEVFSAVVLLKVVVLNQVDLTAKLLVFLAHLRKGLFKFETLKKRVQPVMKNENMLLSNVSVHCLGTSQGPRIWKLGKDKALHSFRTSRGVVRRKYHGWQYRYLIIVIL